MSRDADPAGDSTTALATATELAHHVRAAPIAAKLAHHVRADPTAAELAHHVLDQQRPGELDTGDPPRARRQRPERDLDQQPAARRHLE